MQPAASPKLQHSNTHRRNFEFIVIYYRFLGTASAMTYCTNCSTIAGRQVHRLHSSYAQAPQSSIASSQQMTPAPSSPSPLCLSTFDVNQPIVTRDEFTIGGGYGVTDKRQERNIRQLPLSLATAMAMPNFVATWHSTACSSSSARSDGNSEF